MIDVHEIVHVRMKLTFYHNCIVNQDLVVTYQCHEIPGKGFHQFQSGYCIFLVNEGLQIWPRYSSIWPD